MQTNTSVDVFLSGESSGAETREDCPYPYATNPDPDNGPEHGTSHDRCIMQCPAPIFSSHDLRQQWFAFRSVGIRRQKEKQEEAGSLAVFCFISVEG